MSDNIEKLYKIYSVLADAKEKIGEYEKEYLESISAVKGTGQEKRLASQIITRFVKHFPHLAGQAVDAELDLCEDDDIAIRKQAEKDLAALCRDNLDQLPKVADVLVQLLQAEDPVELSTIHASLVQLFKMDAKGAMGGIFNQITIGVDEVREKAIKFLATKLKTLPPNLFTPDVEEFFMTETKKVLDDVTAEEFVTFMGIISNLKLSKTVSGHQQLIKILEQQAELEKDFGADEVENLERLMQCITLAIPYFSTQVQSTKFVEYMCDKVLPVIHLVQGPEDGGDMQLELLKLLAEMSTFTGTLTDPNVKIKRVFTKLLDYMPLPMPDENAENSTNNDEPKLEFSYVECLMYTFHQMAKKHPEFMTDADQAELLKDFKIRLQYFARGSQAYVKKLRDDLQGKKGEELKSDTNKIKVVALKTTSNINTLIKDLFHNPPSYKSVIRLSWKPVSDNTTATASTTTVTIAASNNNNNASGTASLTSPAGVKRPGRTPITFDDEPKPKKAAITSPIVGKQGRELYAPPSGKYSNKVSSFTNPNPGRGGNARRSRGFGFNRGRGRGRGRFY